MGVLSSIASSAFAADDLRSAILKIPGVGVGSPTDADWQKVGEMTLGATKQNVSWRRICWSYIKLYGFKQSKPSQYAISWFLKPWEKYTGAKINWQDLAQADYNARLQQSIATGTVDFDIAEMGAPFEGDVCGKGMASEMPDWVKRSNWNGWLCWISSSSCWNLGRKNISYFYWWWLS